MNHIAQPANKLEHVIGYAYPTSPDATRLGFGSTGCWTVAVAGKTVPAKTYPDALAVTAKLGTVPGRWSKDHPLNASLVASDIGKSSITRPTAAMA